jgi:hypothetical protein
MFRLETATRACSISHTDTACPPCKIKRIHRALCRDRNSQAGYGIFYSPFHFRIKLVATAVYIAFNIGLYDNVKTR